MRCAEKGCRRKVSAFMTVTCRCGAFFCRRHVYPDHQCDYNHKLQARKEIAAANPKVEKEEKNNLRRI